MRSHTRIRHGQEEHSNQRPDILMQGPYRMIDNFPCTHDRTLHEEQIRTVQPRPAATEGCNGSVQLAEGCIDIWFLSLAAFPADAESLAVAILSKDERKRATGFYFERQRQCYIRSHAALRLLLGRYLMTAPDAIAMVANTYGRPMLAAPAGDLEFNLSHSGDAVLVGVSLRPLGVDIELVRDIPNFLEIAKRHFAPSEVEELLRLAPEQRCESFYVTWTRKEALVKALGLGLSFPLDAFCTGRQDRPPRLTQVGGAVCDWAIADLVPVPGYKAAMAVRQPNVALRCREVSWSWLLARHEGYARDGARPAK
jgi:4'-phosphopantetheinyl transferase